MNTNLYQSSNSVYIVMKTFTEFCLVPNNKTDAVPVSCFNIVIPFFTVKMNMALFLTLANG